MSAASSLVPTFRSTTATTWPAPTVSMSDPPSDRCHRRRLDDPRPQALASSACSFGVSLSRNRVLFVRSTTLRSDPVRRWSTAALVFGIMASLITRTIYRRFGLQTSAVRHCIISVFINFSVTLLMLGMFYPQVESYVQSSSSVRSIWWWHHSHSWLSTQSPLGFVYLLTSEASLQVVHR